MPADRLTVAELQAIRERDAKAEKKGRDVAEHDRHDLLATIDHLAAVIHEACEAEEEGSMLARCASMARIQEMERSMDRRNAAQAALFQTEEEYHDRQG